MSNKWFGRVLLALTTITAACATIAVLYFFETRFAKIITNWEVASMRYQDGAVHVSGEMVKKRPCKLVQTDVKLVHEDGTALLVHQVKPSADVLGVDVTLGHTTWGPIRIPVTTRLLQEVRSGDRFVVTALHQCHGLWLQATEYGSVPADPIMQLIRNRE